MKRPQPDVSDTLRREFIQNVSTVRKLLRLWGTEEVGGVEVLHDRRYYYPTSSRPSNYEELFRYLGAYEDIEENFESKGIEKAWIYFNKNKASKLPTDGSGNDLYSNYLSFVKDNLNKVWWDPADGAMPADIRLTTAVVIQPSADMAAQNPSLVKIEDLIAQGLTDTALAAAIETNFDDLLLTSKITQQGLGSIYKGDIVNEFTLVAVPDEDDLYPNDPWMGALARYAIGDSQVSCTIKDVQIGLAIGRKLGASPETNSMANTVALTVEIPYYLFTTSSTLVDTVATALYSALTATTSVGTLGGRKGRKPSNRIVVDNAVITREAILQTDSSDLNDDASLLNRPYLLWENASTSINPTYDSIWYNGRIRADALRSPRSYGVKYADLSNYLLSIIDADFKKEKVPFWKKVVAFVIFVVAVIYSGGVGAASAGNLLALAKSVAFAAIVLSLTTLALSLAGATEWATAFAEASKTLEPLIIIATIVITITAIQQSFTKAAGDNLIDQALDVAIDSLNNVVDNLIQGAADLTSIQLSELAINFVGKLLNVVNIVNSNKLASIQDRNKDLKAEYERLIAEGYQENDILQGFMNIYARPATADVSIYAAQYDFPYERGGGNLSLGNIQRTTKQAIRRADYSDPVFENILVV